MGLIASKLGIWCVWVRRRARLRASLPYMRARRRMNETRDSVPRIFGAAPLLRAKAYDERRLGEKKRKGYTGRRTQTDAKGWREASRSTLATQRRPPSPISATRFDFFAVFRLFPRLLGSLSLLPIKSLEMHGKTSRSPCRVTSVGWIKWESRAPGKRARSPGLAGPPALASFVPEETDQRPAGRRSGSTRKDRRRHKYSCLQRTA